MLDLLNILYTKASCSEIAIKSTNEMLMKDIKNFSNKQQFMKSDDIAGLMNSFSIHFTNQRQAFGLHGLYPKNAEHCHILRAYMGSLSFSYVKSMTISAVGYLPESCKFFFFFNYLCVT